ncbi:MAG: hypothetical protein BGO09_16410 [Bacteroidetes bacterium 47-18]|nr:MAG: hypothetical protein BGO09_16410 [Bacteroidetes bacterium 47-18]
MKTLLLSLAFVAGTLTLHAQDRPSAVPGQTYGEKITEKGAIDIKELPKLIAKSENGKVQTKIRAKVLEVCSKKGCWLNLELDDKQTVFVKMKDYAFFLPDDAVGKTLILEGEAFEKVTSVNELKHYAEDAGKSQEEIDQITEPQKSIRFMASGIVVPKK